MFNVIIKSKLTYLVVVFYLILASWWLTIYFSHVTQGDTNNWYGFTYAFLALIGGVGGLFTSKKWGGYKSSVGRGIIFFSLGLLGEWFGQAVWSYYNIFLKVPVPYPSIADIGYFSIIPFYAYGMLCFARAAGARFTMRTIKGKLIITILPAVMLGLSYLLFLKDVSPTWSNLIKTFLDFGYPIGESITISVALVTFLLTKGILGGKMRERILFLIFAMVVQYLTDSAFVYTSAINTYYNGGPIDMMYTTSFLTMSLALISFKSYD